MPSWFAEKFEEVASKTFYADQCKPPHNHETTSQDARIWIRIVSPQILLDMGIPVFKCIQKAGDVVLTGCRAYHMGFGRGFKIGEAINYAPVEWLPWAFKAEEQYSLDEQTPTLALERILCGALMLAWTTTGTNETGGWTLENPNGIKKNILWHTTPPSPRG